jgi:DNA-binding HxlR family transcriptional regulator
VKQVLNQAPVFFDAVSPSESPTERAMALIGDKYSLQIIQILNQFGTQRFIELEGQINGISPRTLSQRLKHLEFYGIVTRKQFATIPPRVDYTLTPIGEAMQPILNEMASWTNTWFPHIPAQLHS